MIWARIAPALPAEYKGYKPDRLSARIRYLRYFRGAAYSRHRDTACSNESAVGHSLCSVLVYLNSDFEGGETALCADRSINDVIVRPELGSAFIFDHSLVHEGREIHSGCKYVLRTDVIFV